MELPLEDTNVMEEEKASNVYIEECKSTEELTESTVDEKEQEIVPENNIKELVDASNIIDQEDGPDTVEEVSKTIQEQDVPETVQQKEDVPQTPLETLEINQEAEQPLPPHTAEDQCEAPQASQKKQEDVLNLNNEVVKMRKEVKRVRALIVRKLTRQIGALKKKKGKDADLERNQRRAARLLEEIHAIKTLVPDLVTKTALQKNLNFEQVCKDPKSTISDRAVARIATHPQFNKKIEGIKAAVKAFKDERLNEGKPGGKMQKKADKTKQQTLSTNQEKQSDVVGKSVTPIKKLPKSNMEAESDLELSESDEKEYFDDSTEERFHKQSSGESDESDNDFFVGKVNKFKKKKTKTFEEKTVQKTLKDHSNKLQTNKGQSELDKLEARLKTKATSLNSVFCPSLAGSKTSKSAAKGDQRFAGQDKRKDIVSGNKEFSKQFKGKLEQPDLKYRNLHPRENTFGKEHTKIGGHTKQHNRPNDSRGGTMFTHQAPQQPLHPSWEASKKRKEQQGQILAFQGKKIKFDDDD
ncbi:hypothetical protein WMY93_019255 [Mugilogobius chulae]|uniref:Serum response factor-binding protein 1 n=1 Tax=Mugilogobius chulae TaxID=88201 RepID=A0AAW0NI85_9GOBI